MTSLAVAQLLSGGFEIEMDEVDKGLALFWVAKIGYEEAARLLLSDSKLDITAKDSKGRMPLHYAARYGREAVSRHLLEKNANSIVQAKDNDGCTALHFAAEYGHEAIVRLLLKNNADIMARTNTRRTPLILASEKGQGGVVRLLLNKRADMETRTKAGKTALMLAACNGHETVVQQFLEINASRTAAADKRHASTNLAVRDNHGGTVLHDAATFGHDAIVRMLLDHNADTTAITIKKRTVLHESAMKGHEAVVRILLDKNVDVAARDKENWTPLHDAARYGHDAIVRLLLAKNANIEAEDNTGRTALHLAAEFGHEKVVEMLLDNGADTMKRSNQKRTALYYAASNGYEAVTRLLIDKNTPQNSISRPGSDSFQTPPLEPVGLKRADESRKIQELASRKLETPVDKSGTTLCKPCLSLDIKKLLSHEEVQHQTNYKSMEESSRSGCRLCKLIIDSKFRGWEKDYINNKNPVLCEAGRHVKQLETLTFFIREEGSYWNVFESIIGFCTMPDDPLSSRLRYRLIDTDCRSQASFDLAARWLKKCTQSHQKFCTNKPMSLPTRVLSVGSKDSRIDPYLLITNGKPGRWIALSHCWGSGAPFITTTKNLTERQHSIPFADFPITFQDAITICRRLEIEYLWIDSLCIIQDSEADWLAESVRMSEVYSNATITVIAEASSDSRGGIFATANSGRLDQIPVPCTDSNGVHLGTIYPQAYCNGPMGSTFKTGPLSSRAWTMQEDVLSKRILRYASDQLFWACRMSFHSESNPTIFDKNNLVYDLRNFRREDFAKSGDSTGFGFLKNWYRMVGNYSSRKLTFEKDKFPAISGLAREIAALGRYTYKAGIWQEDSHMGLLWSAYGNGKRTSEYVAPSWSWACLSNSTHENITHVTNPVAEVIDIDVTTKGTDIYSEVSAASIKIRGPCQSIDPWHMKFEHVHADHSSWYDRSYKKTFFDWDVKIGGLSEGIICLLVGTMMNFGDEKTFPSHLAGLLLRPTNRGNPSNEYRRIGLFRIVRRDRKMIETWEEQTVTII